MKHTKTSLGFTLIELLIVVAIIGILAAIAVPNFMNARIRANIARVRADQKSISTALELYHMDNNCYLITMSGASEFYHLTTPTPYLSSVPVDVFLPWKGSRGTASRNPDDRFPTFDYTGNDWLPWMQKTTLMPTLWKVWGRIRSTFRSFTASGRPIRQIPRIRCSTSSFTIRVTVSRATGPFPAAEGREERLPRINRKTSW